MFFNKVAIHSACKSNRIDVIYFLLSSHEKIDNFCFKECQTLRTIAIPYCIKSIGYGSFYICSLLKYIMIPASVKSIEKEAFIGCSSLEEIIFQKPSSLSTIGQYAFRDCTSLSQITLPSSITAI